MLIATIFFVLSLVLTKVFINFALKNKLLDIPNERSSHKYPTPRGGGIVFSVLFVVATCYFYLMTYIPYELTIAILIGVVIIAIGYIDDKRSLSSASRLFAHLICAIALVIFTGYLSVGEMIGVNLIPKWVSIALSVTFIVWMINLYNFMDGINGIAGNQAISTSLLAVVIFAVNEYQPTYFGYYLILFVGCVAGFLIWNFPKAKVFMGDSGSAFLGYSFSVFVIFSQNYSSQYAVSLIILLAIFITDATLTLLSRILSGEKFYSAHKTHVYQIISRHLESHAKVNIIVLAINLFWLFPLAYAVSTSFFEPLVALIIAYAPLALAHLIIRRKYNAKTELV